MNKDYIQGIKNKYQKLKKEVNPKNQKKKQIKLKNKIKNIKKEESLKLLKKNQEKEIYEDKNSKLSENSIQINNNENNNKISQLENNKNIRYFGKEIDEPTSLGQRANQYIIKGNNFKKYFNEKNCIVNSNISKIYENNGTFLELLNIKYINKPQYVIEYRSEIFENLLKEEINNVPNYDKLKDLIDVETRNKYILYILSVCDKITKKEEIHYLSINIFDRAICKLGEIKEDLTEKKLQLICFASLFIAYKYETGCYFLLDDLLKHTEDSLVDKDEVLQYENEINKILNFEYLIVYPSHFLKHFELLDNISNPKIFYFCLYLIDFILSDINIMLTHKISFISASCYFIAKANILKINGWSNFFQFITGYSRSEIKELSIKIIKGMKDSKTSDIFKCLKKKYSKEEYYKVVDLIVGKK